MDRDNPFADYEDGKPPSRKRMENLCHEVHVERGEAKSMFTKIKSGLLASVLVIGALIALNSWTIVPAGEEGVSSSFGEVHQEPLYGFNWVPFWWDIDEFSNQYQTLTWDDVGIPSQDKFKTNMDISYTGRFIRGQGPIIRNSTGKAELYLNTHVNKKILSCAIKAGGTVEKSQRFFDEDVQKMMALYVADCTNEYIQTEADNGFEVTEVQFTDIRLDPQVRQFMVKTKEREEGERQQESLTRAAKERAKIIEQDAEARDKAAAFDRDARMKAADAALYEKQMEAKGNRELAKSITSELVEYTKAKRWNGQMPSTVAGEGTGMILNTGK